MKILIAGGSGFLGSHFIRYLSQKHPAYKLFNLDRVNFVEEFAEVKDFKMPENYQFIQGDVRDGKMVEGAAKDKDIIVNFVSAGSTFEESPESFITTELLGTFNLLEATRKLRIKKMIQISDYEVYGEACSPEKVSRASLEQDPLVPTNPQASAKAGSDHLVHTYFIRFKTPAIILRSSSNFGPFQDPRKLIPLFVIQALEGKKLPVHGDGNYTRDWIYIDDQCKAVDKVLHARGIEGEIFNVGASCERTVLQITELILTILDRPKDLVEFIPDRPGREKRRAVDVDKIRERLSWRAQADFNKSMEKTINWYVENHWWWEKRLEELEKEKKS